MQKPKKYKSNQWLSGMRDRNQDWQMDKKKFEVNDRSVL